MPLTGRRRKIAFRCAVALAAALAACAAPEPPPPGAGPATAPGAGPANVYVVDRGWHTDIGLPEAAISGKLAALLPAFPGARYLAFGFGDRHYVLARNKNLGEMFVALLPGPALLLVTGLRATPAEAFGDGKVVALHVPPDDARRLADFIWRSFEKDGDGRAIRFADGPYAEAALYAAGETYDLVHDCNAWTVEALDAGGLPAGSAFVLFASQVMQRARALAAAETGNQASQQASDR